MKPHDLKIEALQGKYTILLAASSEEMKKLHGILKIDDWGGYSMWFHTQIKSKFLETPSLAAAIRFYNEGGSDAA